MNYLENFIKKFYNLTYKEHCKCIENKLLSFDLYEIQFIIFFKNLHVLLNELPGHINKISKENKRYIYNFSGVLENNDGYFCVTRGFVHINYKRLPDNIYSVQIPIKKMLKCTYVHILILIYHNLSSISYIFLKKNIN